MGWIQNVDMNIVSDSHVPFAQLAPEHRFFYGLAAQAAIVNLRTYLAATQLVANDVIVRRVWDEYKFTPADALHFFQYPGRLEPFLIHSAVKDPKFWCPRLAARRRSRRYHK